MEDLKDLGVVLVGHRRTLLDAIAVLDTRGAATAAPSPSLATAPSGGERRQVTVLFADLVGYTALSQVLNAEALHHLFELFFDRVDGVIKEHSGQRAWTGDTVLMASLSSRSLILGSG